MKVTPDGNVGLILNAGWGVPVARIVYVAAAPTLNVGVAGLVIVGGWPTWTVWSELDRAPWLLVAVTRYEKLGRAESGTVPETSPVVGSIVNQAGAFVSEKVGAGLPSAAVVAP